MSTGWMIHGYRELLSYTASFPKEDLANALKTAKGQHRPRGNPPPPPKELEECAKDRSSWSAPRQPANVGRALRNIIAPLEKTLARRRWYLQRLTCQQSISDLSANEQQIPNRTREPHENSQQMRGHEYQIKLKPASL